MSEKKRFLWQKVFLFCLAVVVMCGCRKAVCRAAGEQGAIRITATADGGQKILANAQFTIYRVADVYPSGGAMYYNYTTEFQTSNVNIGTLGQPAANELLTYVNSQTIAGNSQTTDADGKTSFEALADGLYLVAQTNDVEGFTRTEPFFVSVPFVDDSGSLNYQVDASPKIGVSSITPPPPAEDGQDSGSTQSSGTLSDGARDWRITVSKVWNDNGANRPASVDVHLKKGSDIVGTVTLSAENNWTYVWSIHAKWDELSIEEVVPSGYVATYRRDNAVLTVENTPALAQTGQLKWPIPLMLAMGALMIVIGIRVRRNRNEA